MKKTASHWLLAAGLLPVAAHKAHAAPGVTLYGIVSSAVRYTSNPDGHHNDQAALVSGGLVGSRFGLKGDEDLGGGNHATSSSRPASAATTVAPATTRCSGARPMRASPATGAA